MIRIAKEDLYCDTALSTNGMLLDKNKAIELINAGLDIIRIDFYSDKSKFESIRRGAKWDIVKENISALIEEKKKLKAIKPIIFINSLVFCDEDDVNHTENESSRLAGIFPELKYGKFSTVNAHSFSGEFADELSQNIKYQFKRDPKTYYPCRHAWGGIAITCNGTVLPCCRDVLGKITQSSIMELWNNEKYVNLRRKQATVSYEKLELCRNCSSLWKGATSNNYLLDAIKRYSGFFREEREIQKLINRK